MSEHGTLGPYRSHQGSISQESEAKGGTWHGRILGLGGDVITYEATTRERLEQAFVEAVDDYIACRAAMGTLEYRQRPAMPDPVWDEIDRIHQESRMKEAGLDPEETRAPAGGRDLIPESDLAHMEANPLGSPLEILATLRKALLLCNELDGVEYIKKALLVWMEKLQIALEREQELKTRVFEELQRLGREKPL